MAWKTGILRNADVNIISRAKILISHFNEGVFKERDLPDIQGVLTQRETEMLGCLASGATNQEIASALFLSTNTVKKHINNIFDKLNVKNRVQAAEIYKQLYR